LQRLGLAADEVIAIEDTEMNQAAAIGAGIDCRLFAGEYATVTRGDRQIHDAMQVLQGS
jgi:beta-phosphoglucomutase-like phosphatase (HAD superfamily)